MHFFIDHTQLANQTDNFGPISANPTTQFNVTTSFELSAVAKAFASQDSMMIIQQSSVSPDLVNIIMRPIEGLKIPFSSIAYYIYRGMLKSSFISGTVIKPLTDPDRSDFVTRFWNDWNQYKIDRASPNLPDPAPEIFGYGNNNVLVDSLNVENLFDNSHDAKPVFVREGEWIGTFASSSSANPLKIGIEIITESNLLDINLGFLRAANYVIDTTGLIGLADRAKREEVHAFIDPAAFHGLHFNQGVKVYLASPPSNPNYLLKKKDDLFTTLISRFANKNRVYLDIRSETGYSYNFYGNYEDSNHDNLKIGNIFTVPAAQKYASDGWPLIYTDTSMAAGTNQNIVINLRVDDNLKPLIFLEDKGLVSERNTSNFITESSILNGSSTNWTKDISFYFPGTGTGPALDNVAYYIQLYYFRQQYSASTIVINNFYSDLAFCSVDLKNLGNDGYLLRQVDSENYAYVQGSLPSTTQTFGYIA